MSDINNVVSQLIEVKLKDDNDFLKIIETLTRIGVASKLEKKLSQSCHILHKRGKYYIVHFKELFALDGRETTLNEKDIARRNTIAFLLQDWGLLTIMKPETISENKASLKNIKIISYKDKCSWELIPMYNIGKNK